MLVEFFELQLAYECGDARLAGPKPRGPHIKMASLVMLGHDSAAKAVFRIERILKGEAR